MYWTNYSEHTTVRGETAELACQRWRKGWYHVFGKQFLRPDRPPVFNTSEITHDDELIETTDLLVHGVDLLNNLCRSTDEGETRVEDLFIRHGAKLLDDSTGVEAKAFGTPFGLLFLTHHCVHSRSIEVEVVM